MREYGQVQTAFWSNPDVQVMSDDGKLLMLYCLTGPHSNGLGCFRLPDGYVTADLGWDSERVSKGFDELFRNHGIKRDEATGWVFIPKFLKWNPVTNGNVAKAREKEFKSVPKSVPFYNDLLNALQTLGKHFGKDFETLLQTLSKQDPTRPDPKRKYLVPADWSPNELTLAWFPKQNFSFTVESMIEEYINGCRAHGYKYSDHDAAFKNWCKKRQERFGNSNEPRYDRL